MIIIISRRKYRGAEFLVWSPRSTAGRVAIRLASVYFKSGSSRCEFLFCQLGPEPRLGARLTDRSDEPTAGDCPAFSPSGTVIVVAVAVVSGCATHDQRGPCTPYHPIPVGATERVRAEER